MDGWEVTKEDLAIVLDAHNVKYDDASLSSMFNTLDLDGIEDAVFIYTDFDNQVDSMLEDIENQLMDLGVITCEKKFLGADDDLEMDEDEDWEDDDDIET
jgi:hypothetical protein